MPDALPAATPPLYHGLGQAPCMLACIPYGLILFWKNWRNKMRNWLRWFTWETPIKMEMVMHVHLKLLPLYKWLLFCICTVKYVKFRSFCLQCFDTWLGVRKSIRPVKNWVMRCWHGYLFRVRCRWFAYGPDDAIANLSSVPSLKSRQVLPPGASLPWLSGKIGH